MMKCGKCNAVFEKLKFSVEDGAEDDDLLEIGAECTECGTYVYQHIHKKDFELLDE